MTIAELFQQIIEGLRYAKWYEHLAVFSGIASVWYSRKENILVYPVGLISTIIYTIVSFDKHLAGEATVNFYYTVMSLYGWYMWQKRNQRNEKVLQVTFSDGRMWLYQLLFFAVLYTVIYFSLVYLKKEFFEGAIPWADAFASATAFTGMWLMTRKKVESWYWWIATNIASIPLYFVKGLVLTSVYYLILLVMAFWGLMEWRKRASRL